MPASIVTVKNVPLKTPVKTSAPLRLRFGAGDRALHGLRKTRLLTQGGSVSRLPGIRFCGPQGSWTLR